MVGFLSLIFSNQSHFQNQSLYQELWAWVRNTLWDTHSHIGVIYLCQFTYWHVFVKWEETNGRTCIDVGEAYIKVCLEFWILFPSLYGFPLSSLDSSYCQKVTTKFEWFWVWTGIPFWVKSNLVPSVPRILFRSNVILNRIKWLLKMNELNSLVFSRCKPSWVFSQLILLKRYCQ